MNKIKQGIAKGVRKEDALFKGSKNVNEDVLVVKEVVTGKTVYIKRKDMGDYTKNKGFLRFMDKPILYTEKEVVEGKQLADRTIVEELLKKDTYRRLQKGESVEMTITGFAQNRHMVGAYVESNGVVGFLPAKEYSGQEVSIEQFQEVFTTVDVKLKDVVEETRFMPSLIFTIDGEKRELGEDEGYKQFKKDGIYLGVVTKMNQNAMFVNVARGVDILCSLPHEGHVSEGTELYVRVTKIIEEFGRLRGKFVRFEEVPNMIPKGINEDLLEKEGEALLELDDFDSFDFTEEEEEAMSQEELQIKELEKQVFNLLND